MPESLVLQRFSPAVREWFATSFPAPTAAQEQGWPAIAQGEHTLILAPTGSGKTLAAFLWAIDHLATEPAPADREHRTRVVYVSPLRALAVDVERNLRAPMQGIAYAAERLGERITVPSVGMRTGDTPAGERRRLLRDPPDILITTPESLFLMLTSQARSTLTGVRTVIVDEIHAMAATKRGAHLSLSLERLAHLVEAAPTAGDPRLAPQRIGLSATQRPLDEIARFLGGTGRPVTVVDAGSRKELDVEVIVPVDDMGRMGEILDEPMGGPAASPAARSSIWPSIHPRLLELIESHRSTLVFVNSRLLAERLATRLNELASGNPTWVAGESIGRSPGPTSSIVKAHHGSLAREQRLLIEDDLKAGRLKALVATSSLELGIDMGAVDLVIQVESPGSVSRGLQRIGRAGHQVGQASRGKVFPKHRGDLVEAAVVVARMRQGLVEETRYPRNPIDVLAQQIVAMAALDEWRVDELAALVRRSANFAELGDDTFEAVLDLLAGRYPSEEFAELRPRIVWDRMAGTVRGRSGAQRIAVTNAGTIPDRGLFGVFLAGAGGGVGGGRVGELDEEMVHEARVGETFLLGASTWRIEEITHDRVIVTPAPGEPGRLPFWHGDRPGRPLELGRALGAFLREVRAELPVAEGDEGPVARLREGYGLDERAARNLLAYVEEELAATGHVPDDRTIVVERFRDEIGDWRICILSPFGARVHAPWAMAMEARLAERGDEPVQVIWSDDGIILRLPESEESFPVDDLLVDPEDVEELVVRSLPDTALFAGRFRENAARALLLPRRRPGQRTPLWQQRQRSADLLQVAAKYPTFPILLETTRECLRDVFDLPALREVLGDIRARRIRVVSVDVPKASPFGSSLLFGWVAAYMYEGDTPLAERRATALSLDRDLLRELLGDGELRELLDADALAELELEMQCLTPGRRARDADEVHDLLRRLGDLSLVELVPRCAVEGGGNRLGTVETWVAELTSAHRAIEVMVGGETRLAAAEDAGRLRDGLGVPVPAGIPAAFLESVDRPLDQLVARFARTHGPFRPVEAAARLGASRPRVDEALARLGAEGRLAQGEFRPGGFEREWVDEDVLRTLRRRSLARLRREVEPVDASAFGRFLPAWQGVGERRSGPDVLLDAIARLQGVPLPASVLEVDVLASRVDGYRPADLDLLCALGEVVWVGAGTLGSGDGRVSLVLRDRAATLVPEPGEHPGGVLHDALREALDQRGALFWPDLLRASGTLDDKPVLAALWDLVWAGEVTNDTLAPVRAALGGVAQRRSNRGRPRPGRLTRLGPPTAAGRWSLVAPLLEPAPSTTERLHGRARALLERFGVVTREAVLAEGSAGGFAAVYGVLKAMEETGAVRRGYFVAGLGAAQFALPGAVDRLRDLRGHPVDDPSRLRPAPVVLAATDPANPYGAALPWPESGGRPSRTAGAHVVLVDGEPAVWVERGGRRLVTFPTALQTDSWVGGLLALVDDGRVSRLVVQHVDGEPVTGSGLAAVLRGAGFREGYRGLSYGK